MLIIVEGAVFYLKFKHSEIMLLAGLKTPKKEFFCLTVTGQQLISRGENQQQNVSSTEENNHSGVFTSSPLTCFDVTLKK